MSAADSGFEGWVGRVASEVEGLVGPRAIMDNRAVFGHLERFGLFYLVVAGFGCG